MRMAGDGIEARGTLVRIPEIKLGSLRAADWGAGDWSEQYELGFH
jgi:hypothetical protein